MRCTLLDSFLFHIGATFSIELLLSQEDEANVIILKINVAKVIMGCNDLGDLLV